MTVESVCGFGLTGNPGGADAAVRVDPGIPGGFAADGTDVALGGIFWFVAFDWVSLFTIRVERPPVTKRAISVATTQTTPPLTGKERLLFLPTIAAVIPITASKNPMAAMGIANSPKNGIQQNRQAITPRNKEAMPSGFTPRLISTLTFWGKLFAGFFETLGTNIMVSRPQWGQSTLRVSPFLKSLASNSIPPLQCWQLHVT